MSLNIYLSGSAVLNGASCFLLGLYVYRKDPKNIMYSAYFRYAIALGAWCVGYYFYPIASDESIALKAFRYLHFGAVFMTVTYYHFISTWVGDVNRRRISLSIGYTIAVIFCFFIPTNLFVSRVEPKFIFKFWGVPGPLYHVFLVFISYYAIVTLVLLIKELRKSNGVRRIQCKYLLIATIMGYIGGYINFPLWYNIPIYPILNICITVFIGIQAYAIVRHNLLDIEVIIKRTLVFTGLLASVSAILILPTLLMQEYIFRGTSFGGKMIGFTISAVIIILTMRRIESFLVNVTDKHLFQKKYDYRDLLKTFTSEVLTVLELDKLLSLTVSKLKEIIKLDSCNIELFDDKLKPDDSMLSMAGSKGYILRRDHPDIKEELIIPITMHNDNIGTLSLGKKKSDEEYTQDDLSILLPLARTLAIAISNAKLVDELGKTQAEAAQNEKMATIGTLAAGMAHEIRNPITTIRVFSEYLPDKMGEAQFVDKYRDIVLKQVDRINHIIQTMIDFSADDAPCEVEAISLDERIKDLITLLALSDAISNNIEFTKDIPLSLPMIKVNGKELDEILLNLTQNAIHAIKENGKISFKASEKGNFIVLEIQDNGCGISEDMQKQVFNPFFTTKSKGAGLGLFIVKKLIKRNNANISVNSRVGEGTRFTLEFRKAKLGDK